MCSRVMFWNIHCSKCRCVVWISLRSISRAEVFVKSGKQQVASNFDSITVFFSSSFSFILHSLFSRLLAGASLFSKQLYFSVYIWLKGVDFHWQNHEKYSMKMCSPFIPSFSIQKWIHLHICCCYKIHTKNTRDDFG